MLIFAFLAWSTSEVAKLLRQLKQPVFHMNMCEYVKSASQGGSCLHGNQESSMFVTGDINKQK